MDTPPVVMVPEGGADGLEIHLAELVLNVTPMGGEGSDVYSLYIRIPVTAVADGGYVGLNAAEAVTVHASLIETGSGDPFGPSRLQHSSRARCGPFARIPQPGPSIRNSNLVVGADVLGTITRSVEN